MLVADDDADIRELVAFKLEQEGHEVQAERRHEPGSARLPAVATDPDGRHDPRERDADEQHPERRSENGGPGDHRVRASMVLTLWSSSRGLNGLMT